MRNAMLTALVIVALGSAANAQFSLLPQVGFENSRTSIEYNELNSLTPLGVKFSPQVGIRMDYKFKQGHGVYVGISSSRSAVAFNFTDPENIRNSFIATPGEMKLRLESGYQFNFKPVFFNGSKNTASKKPEQKTTTKSGCGSKTKVVTSRCGSSKSKQVMAKNKGTWMRVQPSLGFAFIPSSNPGIVTKTQNGQTSYMYKAGNWNTGMVAGAGFEFGKNQNRLFTVSLGYFKGIGNLNTETLTTVTATKTTITNLESEVSGWSLKVGIPFSLKKSTPQKKKEVKKVEEKRCGQYRIIYRCGGRN